jgi:hypothetical protein
VFRVLGLPLVSMLSFALWVYAIVDVIKVPESDVRHLPKVLWLLIVFFLYALGALIWIVVGRPPFRGWEPGAPIKQRRPPAGGARGPEDDPGWR